MPSLNSYTDCYSKNIYYERCTVVMHNFGKDGCNFACCAPLTCPSSQFHTSTSHKEGETLEILLRSFHWSANGMFGFSGALVCQCLYMFACNIVCDILDAKRRQQKEILSLLLGSNTYTNKWLNVNVTRKKKFIMDSKLDDDHVHINPI